MLTSTRSKAPFLGMIHRPAALPDGPF